MQNLNYSVPNLIAEYDKILAAKRKNSPQVLLRLRPQVLVEYTSYEDNFATIQSKQSCIFSIADKKELINCYNNETKPLKDLKSFIISSQTDVFKSVCPYCLIQSHSSFDHYIPKDEYAVYSVCARNLVPCCSTCNSKKLEMWREADNSARNIIHFYNDIIPNEQFLNCALDITNLTLNFSLNFSATFDTNLKFIIEKHFERLALLERYRAESSKVIADFVDHNRATKSKVSLPHLVEIITDTVNNQQARYGINYWISLAYLELANPAFLAII
ncbi:HNH endonuclease [Bernardetia sp. OM2101]|uniref:HNH endonuclease n=1 Tax=Bernardetia sp. OM2101 TaxID=3344876 RepID=UPI0035D11D1F